ncbi:hypothetical protein R3X28_18420 [Maribacter sp. TH_r10]|uniref:Uncharacterized protein n=1 Tax=Maribacter luteus TaxID=2594478 RepID=A0A6I2MMN3_9FLAO|nr:MULTISPECIES: hypothetical protein [Maribacter]MDV7140873.1 hypothetical protein [Maribacter sp. TH_r10]MRX64988.1 hypothetical protein [Maribacter luteus]
MKTLFISLFLIVNGLGGAIVQESEKITATYEGFEDGTYYFTDNDGFSNEFQHVTEGVLESYDLTDEMYKGKLFIVTYISEVETDDLDEEITVNTITELKIKE